jgi:hypothetical protein
MKLIRFHHKGRLIAVNAKRVAFVRAGEDPATTYICFSGGHDALVEGRVEDIVAKLSEEEEPAKPTMVDIVSQAMRRMEQMVLEIMTKRDK